MKLRKDYLNYLVLQTAHVSRNPKYDIIILNALIATDKNTKIIDSIFNNEIFVNLKVNIRRFDKCLFLN